MERRSERHFWRLFISQVLVGWKIFLIELKKYKKALLFSLFLTPILTAIDYYLRGQFVGVVQYLGLPLPYVLFLTLSIALNAAVWSVQRNAETYFAELRLLLIKAIHPITIPLGALLSVFPKDLLYTLTFALTIWLLAGVSPLLALSGLLVGYIFGLPLFLALGIVLSTLSFFFRGREYRRISRFLRGILTLLIPTLYGINAYPEPLQPFLLYLPTVSLVEGVRRLVLGLDGLGLLAYSFLSGLLLLFLAYKLYFRVFTWARRTGAVVLR